MYALHNNILLFAPYALKKCHVLLEYLDKDIQPNYINSLKVNADVQSVGHTIT